MSVALLQGFGSGGLRLIRCLSLSGFIPDSKTVVPAGENIGDILRFLTGNCGDFAGPCVS
jgi:hypothetical protein